jgi:RNA polymerase sigma factor (sigma-70 family)
MEVSALKYSGGLGLHGRSPLLRLQSDERLVAWVRRGNQAAFEVLVSRYSSRLLAFCRHLLGCREDAEDVLQEVLAAAFNAMLADDRPINVRPWLYRIARNRCLNHLRRIQAVGVDSMDVHLSDNGASTADKVHDREQFRLLVGDINELPETQKTALVLREMDALSYEQIAEAMETTVPSVKSLLVRARISLAEAAEARVLSCEEVRIELGEIAEGLLRRPSPLVRRHLRACTRCETFRGQLKETNKALAALLPVGPFVILKKLALTHLGHSAGSGATAAGSGAASSGAAAGTAAGGTFVMGSTAGGFVSAGIGAIATKAAAGLAAAALVTAGAVEVDQPGPAHHHPSLAAAPAQSSTSFVPVVHTVSHASRHVFAKLNATPPPPKPATHKPKKTAQPKKAAQPKKTTLVAAATPKPAAKPEATTPATVPGRTQTQTDATVLPSPTPATNANTGTSDLGTSTAPATTTTTTPTSTTTPTTTTTPPPPPPTTTTTPAPSPPPPPGGDDPNDPGTAAGGSSNATP